MDIIAVSICAGFEDKGWTMTAEERAELEALQIRVLTSIHALGDDVNVAFGVTAPNKVVNETLCRFCQGMKVAVECALMAADAGLVGSSQEIISIAGTGEGADTAIVVKPACTLHFADLRDTRILAKPRRA